MATATLTRTTRRNGPPEIDRFTGAVLGVEFVDGVGTTSDMNAAISLYESGYSLVLKFPNRQVPLTLPSRP